MPVGHVVGNRRVGPPGHDDPHPVRRTQAAALRCCARSGRWSHPGLRLGRQRPSPACRQPAGRRPRPVQQVQQTRLPGRLGQRRSADPARAVAHNWSVSTVVNASRVSCAASRAVMKNDTSHTRPADGAGGWSTKRGQQRGLARPRPGLPPRIGTRCSSRQNAASSANSASRSSSWSGAMRSTWRRYAERTGHPLGVLTRTKPSRLAAGQSARRAEQSGRGQALVPAVDPEAASVPSPSRR